MNFKDLRPLENKSGITIKELKDWLANIPDNNHWGEPEEVFIETGWCTDAPLQKVGFVDFRPKDDPPHTSIEFCLPEWKIDEDFQEKLLKTYYSFPITVSPKEFLNGEGNWGLQEEEYSEVLRLAKLICNKDSE